MNPATLELVDILDDAGNTIGTTTRREMRAERLPHRCTYILVFNRKGELFIHLRTSTKDVYPSHWDLCVGGVAAAGESFEQGAERELKEEVGVVAPLTPLFPFRYADSHTIAHGMVYRAEHDGPFQLQAEEVVRGEFVTLPEALRRIEREPFCPDGVAVLRKYLESNTPTSP